MSRAGNRQSSIYRGKDGHWHGRVTVGRKDDGSLLAGSLWQEGGWVFTTLLGRPIAPNSD